ncbi:CobW family GTP-binding protein [Ovoidimarina sediminis]|uniref:CobW family GTP-binding protein n=1 Tax=Ovoidimarina sediminis TaxID=3079856 RepID=UPI00292ED7B0|nr:GTP-binding protein [Rhodophyticola sp. MJ-SS7]
MTILTGFLGAGKTTLLNRYLQSPQGEGTAVLVNEFGAVDVDGAVLGSAQDEARLMTLPNGCVCCEVQEDLAAALIEVAVGCESSGIRHCVIETTGLAEPGSILRGMAHDPRLRSLVAVRQTLTVAAVTSIASELRRFPEAAAQIALADRILATKADIAGRDSVARAMLELATRNPLAEIEVSDGIIDIAEMFRPPEQPRSVPDDTQHKHTDGITTFAVPLPEPLDADRFRDVMSFWIMRHAERILRIKGIVRFRGEDTARLLNVVHDVAEIVPLHDAGPSALVFIGFDLPEAEIRKDIERCT